MPYINKPDRTFTVVKCRDIDGVSCTNESKSFAITEPKTYGELNYAITRMCHEFIDSNTLNYDTINSIIGVLECAKQEFYRVVVGRYEDKKRFKNGSVSKLDAINIDEVR